MILVTLSQPYSARPLTRLSLHSHAHSFTHTLNTHAHFLPQPHPSEILPNVTTFVGVDDGKRSEMEKERGWRGGTGDKIGLMWAVGRPDGLEDTTDCVGAGC